jgi:hypothetical protein
LLVQIPTAKPGAVTYVGVCLPFETDLRKRACPLLRPLNGVVRHHDFAPPNDAVDRDWLSLRSKLWPGAESEHLREMATALALGLPVLLAIDAGGPAAGFVVAPMRVDFVNGTNS